MEYIHGQGLTAMKHELVALLAFCNKKLGNERLKGVGVRISEGRLLVQATDGYATLYHHGSTMDEGGQPCLAELELQIGPKVIEAIAKVMRPADEVLFVVDKKQRMTRAIVRDIESAETSADFSIGNYVSAQLSIPQMSTSIPDHVQQHAEPCGAVVISPSLLKRLPLVAKAAGSEFCRWVQPESETGNVYVEFDSASALDVGGAKWLVVMAPVDLEQAVRGEEEDAA